VKTGRFLEALDDLASLARSVFLSPDFWSGSILLPSRVQRSLGST
jgi:hypothetical protein